MAAIGATVGPAILILQIGEKTQLHVSPSAKSYFAIHTTRYNKSGRIESCRGGGIVIVSEDGEGKHVSFVCFVVVLHDALLGVPDLEISATISNHHSINEIHVGMILIGTDEFDTP